ncbi:MAG: endonuclease domain-containing protein [Leucobacter sp.]|nr:endonuclease domain-containing protein [Leucobacter sp.]
MRIPMHRKVLPRDKQMRSRSTELRNNATKEENHLWYDYLRAYPVRFCRQRIIGKYIVGFFCPKAKLVIELDGSQHYEPRGLDYDAVRTAYLENLGIIVLRFTNLDANENFYGVCDTIYDAIGKRIKGSFGKGAVERSETED